MNTLLAMVMLMSCGEQRGEKQLDSSDTAGLWAGLPEHPNVLFVLTDTLRADHLNSYGYHRDTTPWFEAFAAESVLFEEATSQNAWTPPSVSSIFTGLYARAHGVVAFHDPTETGGNVLVEAHHTLAELFSEAGYRTGALVKSPVPRAETGFSQGFGSFETVSGKISHGTSGEELATSAMAWLDEAAPFEEPFFLYLHFMEPHTPYIAPSPYAEQFDEGWDSEFEGTHVEMVDLRSGEKKATADDREHIVSLYDGELAYWDVQVAKVVSHLEQLGLLEETLVVFVGDHGEQFGEHGDWLHGALYQENIHVPMVLRIPGVGGRRIPGPVQVMDITPTIAALCGLSPLAIWQARDLRPSIALGRATRGSVFAQYGTERALVSPDRMKFLFEDGVARLFDLHVDPHEQNDLAGDPAYSELLSDLQREADQILDASADIAAGIGN
jgi:arylsulfatase A-like enzyme